jgi:tripartite ATP-independent transporter DctP family solute receptor
MMLSAGRSEFICGLLLGIFISSCCFAVLYRYSGQQSNVTVLKLGHGLDQTHPVHLAMVYMRDRLAELSDGTMRLDIYPGGMLGTEPQCLEQVQTGLLDMAKSSVSPMETFWPELQIFTIPYVFLDSEHLWQVLDGEIGREFLEMSPEMYGLCYYDAGARSFYSVSRPILSPDCLRGMKIRVQQSRTAMDMIRHMGAAPTPISFGELYTALSQGTVDGAENNLPSFESGRHSEICRHFSLNEHAFVPDMLLINRNRWNSLSPLQQQWLKTAAVESSIFQRELWGQEEQSSRAASESRGVTFHEVDKTPFIEVTAPMRENISDPTIRELLRRIDEVYK